MAKKITGYIKLQVPAGAANPSPPIGPALGQRGVNIMEFCKAFNAATEKMDKGTPLPTIITVYADRSFSFITKQPPATYLIIDLLGGVVFALVLLVALLIGDAGPLVWIGVMGMGLSIASAFPSALSYVGNHINMTGKITGSLFASANIGVMVVPWVIGQLFQPVGTIAIPISGALLLSLATVVFVWIRRELRALPQPVSAAR